MVRPSNPSFTNDAKPSLGNDSIQYRIPEKINGKAGTLCIALAERSTGR